MTGKVSVNIGYKGRTRLMQGLAAIHRQYDRLMRKLDFAHNPHEINQINTDMRLLNQTRRAVEDKLRRIEQKQKLYVVRYLHRTWPWDEIIETKENR